MLFSIKKNTDHYISSGYARKLTEAEHPEHGTYRILG